MLAGLLDQYTLAGVTLSSHCALHRASRCDTIITSCRPVCVPFYVMHKMLAELLDQYTLAGLTLSSHCALHRASRCDAIITPCTLQSP
eukprot:1877113-Pyramimonas_sp.AAC.1